MTIDTAIDDARWFLSFITPGAASSDEVAEAAYNASDAIGYLVDYIRAIRPTPTRHDQEKEMEKWDEFFHEMRERAENG